MSKGYKNKEFFFCYNKNISDYVRAKGIKHITVAQDPITKKIFTLFKFSQELQDALDEFQQR